MADSGNWKVRVGPAGIHLFRRRDGLNVLAAGRTRTSDWSRAPMQVSIALTNACDLRCAFCYAPKFAASLRADDVDRWLGELDHHGCLGVGFGGGEPTLHPNFVDICRAASRRDLAVTFTTHGHRLTNGLAVQLRGLVHFIRVSVDGVGFTYETIRGRPFADLLKQLDLIKTIAPFGINVVVNEATVACLDETAALATRTGARELLLLPEAAVRGRGGISQRAMDTLREWVASYRGGVQLAISETAAEAIPGCSDAASESGLRAYAHIDARGQLKRRSFDVAGAPIGSGTVLDALGALEGVIS